MGYCTRDSNKIVYILDSKSKTVVAVTHSNPKNAVTDFQLINTFRVPTEFCNSTMPSDYQPKDRRENCFFTKKKGFLGIKLLYSVELDIASWYMVKHYL